MLEENQQFRPIIPKQICVEPTSSNLSSNRTVNSGILPVNGVIIVNEVEGAPNSYSDTKRLPAGRVLSPKSIQRVKEEQLKEDKLKPLNQDMTSVRKSSAKEKRPTLQKLIGSVNVGADSASALVNA